MRCRELSTVIALSAFAFVLGPLGAQAQGIEPGDGDSGDEDDDDREPCADAETLPADVAVDLVKLPILGLGFVSPARVAAAYRFAGDGSEGGASGALTLLREARTGHRLTLGRVTALLLAGPTDFNPVIAIDVLALEQYFYRDPVEGCDRAPIFTSDFPLFGNRNPVCAPEPFGYFVDLGAMRFQPRFGHIGLRLIEAGAIANLLGTGRTDRVWRDHVVIRAGVNAEYVDPRDVSRPTEAAGTHWSSRGVVGLHVVTSSSDRTVRVSLDVDWRPSFGALEDDHFIESSLEILAFAQLHEFFVLGFFARGEVAYASRPWMVVSRFADPRFAVTAVATVGVEVYWTDPALYVR